MKRQGTDPTSLDDVSLVRLARSGDRLAFGVLYLRHSEAAWRVACAVSGFSSDAELAVIEGFTTVFGALPRPCAPEDSFRPYLLACVRQAALGRRPRRRRADDRRPRRPEPARAPEPGVVVLSGLEHHVLIGALRDVPERWRTALWLIEVERLTPAEASAILGLDPPAVTAVAAEARDRVFDAGLEAHRRSVFRYECQRAVDRLGAYVRDQLSPQERTVVREHLDGCLPCRMRRSELTDVGGSLLGAVPPMPLLGGECQRHWLASGPTDARPSRARSPGWATTTLRLVPSPVGLAAAMLGFVFGLASVAAPPRAKSPSELAAAPASEVSELSDVPPPPPRRPKPQPILLTAASPAPETAKPVALVTTSPRSRRAGRPAVPPERVVATEAPLPPSPPPLAIPPAVEAAAPPAPAPPTTTGTDNGAKKKDKRKGISITLAQGSSRSHGKSHRGVAA